jgi:hypothetical protein
MTAWDDPQWSRRRDWLRAALSVSIAPLEWELRASYHDEGGVWALDVGPFRFAAMVPWRYEEKKP